MRDGTEEKEKKEEEKAVCGSKIWDIFSGSAVGDTFILLLLVIGYFWMDSHGRSAFAQKQEAVPEQMQDFSVSENDAGKALEAGTLRYNGKTYAYKRIF